MPWPKEKGELGALIPSLDAQADAAADGTK